MSGFALSRLSQDFEAGVGQQGVSGSGLLECVLDELGKMLAFEDGVEFGAHHDAAVERGIGSPAQGGGELFEADEPNGHAILRVEGEVQEGRQIAEEFGGEVLGFVENPNRQAMFLLGEILDAFFDVPPQLRASKRGFESESQSEVAIQVEAREVGVGRVEDEEAVRVEFGGNLAQGGGFADAGRSCQQSDAGLFEKPDKLLLESGELPVVEKFSGLFAERWLCQSEVLLVHDHSSVFGLNRRA